MPSYTTEMTWTCRTSLILARRRYGLKEGRGEWEAASSLGGCEPKSMPSQERLCPLSLWAFSFFFYPHLRTFFHSSFIEREERRGRNVDWLPPVRAWTRDRTHNLSVTE